MMHDCHLRNLSILLVDGWPMTNRYSHYSSHYFRMCGFAVADYAAYHPPGDCPSIVLLSPHLLRYWPLHYFLIVAVGYAVCRTLGSFPSTVLLDPHFLRCLLHHSHYETLPGMSLPVHQIQKQVCWSSSHPSQCSLPHPFRHQITYRIWMVMVDIRQEILYRRLHTQHCPLYSMRGHLVGV